MEGYLLKDTYLRIKADPSFFCPFSKSLLLEPVTLIVGSSIYNVERASLEDWFEHVGKEINPMTGKRITTWVVIKPNNALRERIQAWALQQKLDMDALQAAALKARRLRQAMARGLPRASSDTKLSHQPSSGCLPREDSSGWQIIDVTKPTSACCNVHTQPISIACSNWRTPEPAFHSKRSHSPRSLSVPRCVRA